MNIRTVFHKSMTKHWAYSNTSPSGACEPGEIQRFVLNKPPSSSAKHIGQQTPSSKTYNHLSLMSGCG